MIVINCLNIGWEGRGSHKNNSDVAYPALLSELVCVTLRQYRLSSQSNVCCFVFPVVCVYYPLILLLTPVYAVIRVCPLLCVVYSPTYMCRPTQ